MKKYVLPFLLFVLFAGKLSAQSNYNSVDYAASGDTLYLTQAQTLSFNFDTTGANVIWNYSALTGVSQRRLVFRLPTQCGFTLPQWPYIYNSANVNLASTDGQSLAVGNFQYTDPYDYFLKSSSLLEQKASSQLIVINGNPIALKNVLTSPDIIYHFPLSYGNQDSCVSGMITSIPGIYYRESSLKRVNKVNGWGTVITPYGTFSNCLKVVSDLMQIDSIQIDTFAVPLDTVYSREYKWLDPSTNYPVLVVKQTRVGQTYITQSAEYFDVQQYFQPTALFAYYPVAPIVADTVLFQNLSANTSSYRWNFGDPSSGADDSSSLVNPQHIFNAPGTYNVRLIATNGNLSDTIILPVLVSVMTSVYENQISEAHCYPNPANDKISIPGFQNSEGEIFLYNSKGNLVKQIPFQPELDISEIAPGMYFILIRNGNEFRTERLIKK